MTPTRIRPEYGFHQLAERVCGKPGDQHDQRDTSPYGGYGLLHGPGAAHGRTLAPVRGKRETKGKIADEQINRRAADQTEPGYRAQPRTGCTPPQRQRGSI